MQMAVTAISDMNKRVRGGAAGAKEDWLDTVNKNLEQEQKVRTGSREPGHGFNQTDFLTF